MINCCVWGIFDNAIQCRIMQSWVQCSALRCWEEATTHVTVAVHYNIVQHNDVQIQRNVRVQSSAVLRRSWYVLHWCTGAGHHNKVQHNVPCGVWGEAATRGTQSFPRSSCLQLLFQIIRIVGKILLLHHQPLIYLQNVLFACTALQWFAPAASLLLHLHVLPEKRFRLFCIFIFIIQFWCTTQVRKWTFWEVWGWGKVGNNKNHASSWGK